MRYLLFASALCATISMPAQAQAENVADVCSSKIFRNDLDFRSNSSAALAFLMETGGSKKTSASWSSAMSAIYNAVPLSSQSDAAYDQVQQAFTKKQLKYAKQESAHLVASVLTDNNSDKFVKCVEAMQTIRPIVTTVLSNEADLVIFKVTFRPTHWTSKSYFKFTPTVSGGTLVEPTKGDEWTGGSKDIHVKRGKEDATVVLTARLEGKKSEDYASTAWAPFPYTTKVTKKNFRRRPDQLKTYEVNANCGIVNNVNQSSAQIFNPEAFRGPRKGWIEIQMVRPVNVTQSPTAVHNISSVTAERQDDGTWHGRANCQTLVQPSPVSVSGQFEVLLQETLLELVDPRTED